MTRYILVGGRELHPPGGQELCQALAAGLARPVRVLSCFFAEPEDTWEEKFNRKGKTFFQKYLGKGVTVELARPESFERQARKADVIYLHGGDTGSLKTAMAPYQNLAALFKGKTVVGSSAGAQFLSRLYWTCDRREFGTGAGFVPCAVMVHFGSDYGSGDPRGSIDWLAAKSGLEQKAGALPVYCLHEGEFKVVEAA